MKTNEQLKAELYAPLPSEAIKPHPTKTFLSTIKPIYVTDRLNEVFGIGGWQLRTENVLVYDNGTVVNKVIFTVPEYDIYYECFGGNDNGGQTSKGFDLGDAFKGATTDGLTKICSYLGIGIDVFRGKQSAKPYNTPAPVVKAPATKPADERLGDAKKELDKIITDTKDLMVYQKNFKATPEGSNFKMSSDTNELVNKNDLDSVSAFYRFVTKK